MRLSRNLINWVIAIVLGGSLATYQMAPQWHAWWGLMDDAEFLGWAPRGQSLAAQDYLSTLATTEIGRIGTTTRFRPVYYVLRVAERTVWPSSPAWYYGARTGLFALALSLTAWAVLASLGSVIGAGTFALVSTAYFWTDVWAHGGPAEQYAFAGTSMLAVAGVLAWTDARTTHARGIAWIAAAGTMLAMGSKENFLVLVLPCAIVLWQLARAPEHRRLLMTLLVVVVLAAAAIVAALLPGLRLAGADMYGNQIGASQRFAWLSTKSGMWLAAVAATCAAVPLVAWRLLPSVRRTDEARARLTVLGRRFHAQTGLLVLLFASQLTFYAPHWPTFGSRYDFPGLLVFPLGFAALAIFVLRWLTLAGAGARSVRGMSYVIALAAFAMALRHGPAPVRAAAEGNARTTRSMQAVLEDAVRQAKRAGQATPVIVEWQFEREEEPAMSVTRLLYEAGSDGPFFLRARPGASAGVPLAKATRDGSAPADWKGVMLQPGHALPAALATSGGVAVIVTLDGYAVPRVRQERAP